MVLSENFIVGDSIKEELPDIIDKIKRGKKSYSFYCITKPSNPKNLFDIYCYASLFGRYYKNFNSKIIALAGSKEEAISLIIKMTEEVNTNIQKSEEKDFGKQFREYLKRF